jgi:hypothetical protein
MDFQVKTPAGGHAGGPAPKGGDGSVSRESVRELKNAALSSTAARIDAGHHEVHEEPEGDEDVGAPREREDIESVNIELPDGRVIEYGPPKAAYFRVSELLAGVRGADITMQNVVRLLLGVRAVDGQPVRQPSNYIEVRKLADKIGEAGIDMLGVASNEFWPPVTKQDLRVLKKNLR